MPPIPQPVQRRYRGNILSAMQQARDAIARLLAQDAAFRAKPCSYYPTQLAPIAEINALVAAETVLNAWVIALGPIATRPGC
jgi:hypothetical protein